MPAPPQEADPAMVSAQAGAVSGRLLVIYNTVVVNARQSEQAGRFEGVVFVATTLYFSHESGYTAPVQGGSGRDCEAKTVFNHHSCVVAGMRRAGLVHGARKRCGPAVALRWRGLVSGRFRTGAVGAVSGQ